MTVPRESGMLGFGREKVRNPAPCPACKSDMRDPRDPRFSRRIAHVEWDRVATWECPDCGHRWQRGVA